MRRWPAPSAILGSCAGALLSPQPSSSSSCGSSLPLSSSSALSVSCTSSFGVPVVSGRTVDYLGVLRTPLRPQSSAGKRLPPPPPRIGGMGIGGSRTGGSAQASAAGQQGGGRMMPPPPPLPSRSAGGGSPSDDFGCEDTSGSSNGNNSGSSSSSGMPHAAVWRSPPEILSLFIDYIPTFYVPANCVAAILCDESRALVKGRGKFNAFLKKYRFFFDARLVDGARVDVKLRDDVNHPKKGFADDKFVMTDVGDVTTYTARPEFITSLESLESFGGQSVTLRPHTPPPSVHVRLEERVPVLERLKLLVPRDFIVVEELEEKVPEDILFHPYFDCQGGLLSIANKFPEYFQVVDGRIRLRPPHLAPMATGELSFDNSPMPELISRIRRLVCLTDVPQWVSVTALYEQLSSFEKRAIKRDFKSFAGFLRAHGRSLAISADTLSVALWVPPQQAGGPPPPPSQQQQQASAQTQPSGPEHGRVPGGGAVASPPQQTATAKGVPPAPQHYQHQSPSPQTQQQKPMIFTHAHILNELFDKFPPGRALPLKEALELLPLAVRASAPRDFGRFLAIHSNYFLVDFPEDSSRTAIRKAMDREPLDIADAFYPYIYSSDAACPAIVDNSRAYYMALTSSSPSTTSPPPQRLPAPFFAAARVADLLPLLPEGLRRHVIHVGIVSVARSLPHWLSLLRVQRVEVPANVAATGGATEGGQLATKEVLVPLSEEELQSLSAASFIASDAGERTNGGHNSIPPKEVFVVANRRPTDIQQAIQTSCAQRRGRAAAGGGALTPSTLTPAKGFAQQVPRGHQQDSSRAAAVATATTAVLGAAGGVHAATAVASLSTMMDTKAQSAAFEDEEASPPVVTDGDDDDLEFNFVEDDDPISDSEGGDLPLNLALDDQADNVDGSSTK